MEHLRLRPKYMVYRIPGNTVNPVSGVGMKSTDPDNVDSPFVLMPAKDPAAFRAMICYARFCEPGLRAEIATWLNKIAGAKPAFGTQGTRNYAEMKAEEVRLGL